MRTIVLCLFVCVLLCFGNSSFGAEKEIFENLTTGKRGLSTTVKIGLVGPLPSLDHYLLVGIEKAHPGGYNSPMEAWEALGLYAQQGDAFWIMAVCHHRNTSKNQRTPWSIIPLAKQDKKGKLSSNIFNMMQIGEKLEVRFTMVRSFIDSNYNGVDMERFKRSVLLGKIPAPICPPDLNDVMNLMKTFVCQEFMPHSDAFSQMEVAYSVTPAGLFVMNIKKEGSLYKEFHKKKFANFEKALGALQQFPSSMLSFVAKVRYSSKMLSHGYSDVALVRLNKGDNATVMKEFEAKKKLLKEYIALLEKRGVILKFFPFQNQEKFWN